MKHTKRYSSLLKDIDLQKKYMFSDALDILKKVHSVKFDETVDISINLNIDAKRSDQNIRSTVVLPNGTGKTKKILVISTGENLKIAEKLKVDYFGDEDIIEKISGGWFDFDVLIATPDKMKSLGKIGKLLGPRGLMPNPKTGTVTNDIRKAVEEVRLGKVEFRVDSYGILHLAVGKVSFDIDKIILNIRSLFDVLFKIKPSSVKGNFVKGVFLSSTMGPGLKIDLVDVLN